MDEVPSHGMQGGRRIRETIASALKIQLSVRQLLPDDRQAETEHGTIADLTGDG